MKFSIIFITITVVVPVIIFLILLKIFAVVGPRKEAAKIANSIPQYPGSTMLATFKTTWPDDTPSSGITYATNADLQKVLSYYLKELPELGWHFERKVRPVNKNHLGPIYFTRDRWRLNIIVAKVNDSNQDKKVHIRVRVMKK